MVIYNPSENTNRLALPYIMPSQAQKHVTVNEALRRLDGIVQLTLQEAVTATPPIDPQAGATYFIGQEATGAWTNQAGQLAVWQDDGWIFVSPKRGWRAYLLDINALAIFDGVGWKPTEINSTSTNGAARDRVNLVGGLDFVVKRFSLDFTNSNARNVTFSGRLPQHHMAFGLTAVVTEEIRGPNSVNIGDQWSSNRFATTMGVSVGTQIRGLCNPPFVYWEDSGLIVQVADEGPSSQLITGGKIDIALYLLTLKYPLG